MKYFIIIIVGAAIVVGAWFTWRWVQESNNAINYRLAYVQRGDVVQTVNATGTVEPLQLIQVGTQVTGPVKKLYADFNSRVTEGTVVAQIDPAIYDTNVAQSKANLARSKAGVEQIKANLALAEKELVRARELAVKSLISKSELDTAEANRDSLIAQLKSAEATVTQSESSLQTAQVNLDYTTIKSPVDGIIISRNVDEGQTVVASQSAQLIFVIATDLKKVKIEATVPESDIGKIAEGQPVTFTVDAYIDREFYGIVTQVRLSPTNVQNVVTYTVIINADNADEKLLPGMTANLIFEVARAENKLKVPNAALRFTPDSNLVQEEPELAAANDQTGISPTGSSGMRPMGQRNGAGRGGQREPGMTRKTTGKNNTHSGKLWVRTKSGQLKALPVRTGISDGSFTEVMNKELTEGEEIVTGIMAKGEVAAQVTNPFAPQRFGPGGGRPPGR